MRYAILYKPNSLLFVTTLQLVFDTRADAESALAELPAVMDATGKVVPCSVEIVWKVGNIWRNLLGQTVLIHSNQGASA